MVPHLWTSFMLLSIIGLAVGCSSGESRFRDELMEVERNIEALRSGLDEGSLRNASFIKQYAAIVKTSKPDLMALLIELEKDATPEGPLFKSLESRADRLKNGTDAFASWTERLDEATRLRSATGPEAFNDALSDTVNVLADLSDGELARVNAVSRSAEQQLNASAQSGYGGQYIGNPHYGHWQHGTGGSFWTWYAAYSLFGRDRYYYNDWSGNRGYSYYHDVGRDHYTSRSQYSRQQDVDTRAQKQFGSTGKYKSPYSKTRSGATGLSGASKQLQKSSAFKSQYASASKPAATSSTSKFQSSSRSSSYRTSSGASRGK